MKKFLALLIITLSFCILLSSCGDALDEKGSPTSGDSTNLLDFSGSKSSIFQSLSVTEGDAITGELEVYLSKTEAAFLYIEADEPMEGVLNYTYTTHDEDGAVLAYHMEDSIDNSPLELEPATAEAYDSIWLEQEISLQEGINVFSLSGEDINCKMKFEVKGLDKHQISYVGAFSQSNGFVPIEPLEPMQ